jgi:hypothetical protein
LKWFVCLYHFSLAQTEPESCNFAGHSFTTTHAASLNIYIYTYHLSFPAIWISQSDCSVLCFLSTEHSDRTIGQSDCFVISYAWTHLHLNFRASNNCVSCGFKNSSGIPNRKIESRTTKNARISKRFHFPQRLISLYTKVEASFL